MSKQQFISPRETVKNYLSEVGDVSDSAENGITIVRANCRRSKDSEVFAILGTITAYLEGLKIKHTVAYHHCQVYIEWGLK